MQSLGAVLARTAVLLIATSASANDKPVPPAPPPVPLLIQQDSGLFARKQTPDDWSNAAENAMFSLLVGIGAVHALPSAMPVAQWAVCQIPTIYWELHPKHLRSNRDLIVGASACAFGVWAGHGFGVQPVYGGVKVTYVWAFR